MVRLGRPLVDVPPTRSLAFEVDHVFPRVRSVVVTGVGALVTDADAQVRLGRLQAWVPGIKDVFIRLPPTEVTGREVVRVPATGSPPATTV